MSWDAEGCGFSNFAVGSECRLKDRERLQKASGRGPFPVVDDETARADETEWQLHCTRCCGCPGDGFEDHPLRAPGHHEGSRLLGPKEPY